MVFKIRITALPDSKPKPQRRCGECAWSVRRTFLATPLHCVSVHEFTQLQCRKFGFAHTKTGVSSGKVLGKDAACPDFVSAVDRL